MRENTYCVISGKMLNILKYYLTKCPNPTPMIILKNFRFLFENTIPV